MKEWTVDGKHMGGSGTSMSSPQVAGGVAQLLQIDPKLFPRPLLRTTAVTDRLTDLATLPDAWGSGKLDLVAAAAALNSHPASPVVTSLSASVNGSLASFTAVGTDADAGDSLAEFIWDFDSDGHTDAITNTGSTAWTYDTAGTYTPSVIAVDKYGRTSTTVTGASLTTTSAAPSGGGNSGGGSGGGIINSIDLLLLASLSGLAWRRRMAHRPPA